jgi:PIN domain nuclease of toxin-antitoxin system
VSDVLDASAILAYLQGEDGAPVVEDVLGSGASCGAANWSEVAQKVRSRGRDWPLARALLLSWGLAVDDVTVGDAERAAELWQAGSGLSLADRLCLALGDRRGGDVWTADRAWGETGRVRQIR